MSNFSIKLHSICEMQDGKKYRIVDISSSFITLIEMDTSKFTIFSAGTNTLYFKILEGDVKLTDPDSDVVVDMDFLSGEQKEKYEADSTFIHDVEAHIQTSELTFRDTGKVITELCLKHGMTAKRGRTIIRRYLQSGRSRLAICDQRVIPGKSYPRSNYSSKPGRPVEFGIKQGVIRDDLFYEAIDSAYKKYMEGFSMHEAYEEALKKHYSYKTLIDGEIKSEIKPDSEIPTFRQVQYELTKRLSQKDKDLRIMNSTELRNSKRLLLSDNLNGVLGPGDLAEIDNCEADISLVSESDRTQSVGRPIITVMIDVYSRMILAVSVGFDNNSIIALTSCLRFLAEDPKDILQKYGIEYDGPALVTGVYPSRVRPDRGPEYKSHKFLKICNRLGIERSLVPAATGSMKGLVENLFSVLTRADSAFFKGSGLIRKGYDPDHHKQAVMTISEYTKHVLLKTIEHNTKYMKGYPLTPDQIRNKIPPIPITLFMDGIEEHGMIRRIKNREQFLFDILVDDTAKISKKGITWKGLYYTADDIEILDLMYEAGTKSKPIQIRRDKRDVSYLYYTKKDGRVLHLDLNLRKHGQDQYVGMSEEVLLYFRSQKRQMDKKGESYNTRMNAGFNELTEGIVKEAKKKTSMALDGGTVSTKDMRKRRAEEKARVQKENSVAGTLNTLSGQPRLTAEKQRDNTAVASPKDETVLEQKGDLYDPRSLFEEDFDD